MKFGRFLWVAGISLVAASLAVGFVYTKFTEEHVVTTITKTDRECKSSSDGGTNCRYMIYTPDEVFENVDSWWYFKFNSTDYHNKLSSGIGQKYDLTVYGWRLPIISWYRNVVDYEQEIASQ